MHEPKRLHSLEDYNHYMAGSEVLRTYKSHLLERLLKPGWRKKKTPKLPGYSVPAGDFVEFFMDPTVRLPDGSYNLRENIKCPQTAFNCRMRAAIHAVSIYEADTNPDVYITEQKTPLFRFFQTRFPSLTGSEYLGDEVPRGQTNHEDLRNEDATRLSFAADSFDVVMSFEVLEHIPDYTAALQETFRVLRPGGRFYFTAPFTPNQNAHLIRARIENGAIIHLMEPEMHGDPVTGDGILCFQHFGWNILSELQSLGFKSASALIFDQIEYGYYTQDPVLVFQATA